MTDHRFGPNTAEVEAFLDRIRRLTPQEWERIRDAAPLTGAVADLDMQTSLDYFTALQRATEIAKSNVFPGSETAYFDAMRTAHVVASEAVPVSLPVAEIHSGGDPEAELNQLLNTAFSEESWQRAVNVLMVAAGTLVMRAHLAEADLRLLLASAGF